MSTRTSSSASPSTWPSYLAMSSRASSQISGPESPVTRPGSSSTVNNDNYYGQTCIYAGCTRLSLSFNSFCTRHSTTEKKKNLALSHEVHPNSNTNTIVFAPPSPSQTSTKKPDSFSSRSHDRTGNTLHLTWKPGPRPDTAHSSATLNMDPKTKKLLDSKHTARKSGSASSPTTSAVADSIHVASRPPINGVNGRTGNSSSPSQPPFKKPRLSTDKDESRTTRSHLQSPLANGMHRPAAGSKHTRSSRGEDMSLPSDRVGLRSDRAESRSSSRIRTPAAAAEAKPKQGDTINVHGSVPGPVRRPSIGQRPSEANSRPPSRQTSSFSSMNGSVKHAGRRESEVGLFGKETPSRSAKLRRASMALKDETEQSKRSQEQQSSDSPISRDHQVAHTSNTNGVVNVQNNRQNSLFSSDRDSIQPSITVHPDPSSEPRTLEGNGPPPTENGVKEGPRREETVTSELSDSHLTLQKVPVQDEGNSIPQSSTAGEEKSPVPQPPDQKEKSPVPPLPARKEKSPILESSVQGEGNLVPQLPAPKEKSPVEQSSVRDEANSVPQLPAQKEKSPAPPSSAQNEVNLVPQLFARKEKSPGQQSLVHNDINLIPQFLARKEKSPVQQSLVRNEGNSLPQSPVGKEKSPSEQPSLQNEVKSVRQETAQNVTLPPQIMAEASAKPLNLNINNGAQPGELRPPQQTMKSMEPILQHTGAMFAVDHGTRQMAAKRASQQFTNGTRPAAPAPRPQNTLDAKIRQLAIQAGKAPPRKSSKPRPVDKTAILKSSEAVLKPVEKTAVLKSSEMMPKTVDKIAAPHYLDSVSTNSAPRRPLIKANGIPLPWEKLNGEAPSQKPNGLVAPVAPMERSMGSSMSSMERPMERSMERSLERPMEITKEQQAVNTTAFVSKASALQTTPVCPVSKPAQTACPIVFPTAKNLYGSSLGSDVMFTRIGARPNIQRPTQQGEDTLSSHIYGEENERNRPAEALYDVPSWALPPNPPATRPLQFAHINPKTHWTFSRTPEWHRKKQAEIAARGNRKAPLNFGQAAARLAKRKMERPKTAERVELPERVRKNAAWMKAVEQLNAMADEYHEEQRSKYRRKLKGKSKARADSDGDIEMTDASPVNGNDESPSSRKERVVHGYEYMINREWVTVK